MECSIYRSSGLKVFIFLLLKRYSLSTKAPLSLTSQFVTSLWVLVVYVYIFCGCVSKAWPKQNSVTIKQIYFWQLFASKFIISRDDDADSNKIASTPRINIINRIILKLSYFITSTILKEMRERRHVSAWWNKNLLQQFGWRASREKSFSSMSEYMGW